MYLIDDRDEVSKLDGLPLPSAGAPMPRLLANDIGLVLAYETAPDGPHIAVVKFIRPRAHYFGPPNDEGLTGHPLALRGLEPYGLFEIRHSSWIRAQERMNRVHPGHDAQRFEALMHFVLTFHDRTFECIAEGVGLVETLVNDPKAMQILPNVMAGHAD